MGQRLSLGTLESFHGDVLVGEQLTELMSAFRNAFRDRRMQSWSACIDWQASTGSSYPDSRLFHSSHSFLSFASAAATPAFSASGGLAVELTS